MRRFGGRACRRSAAAGAGAGRRVEALAEPRPGRRYPTLSLADARRRARQVLGEVASYGDPAQARQDARHAPTFEDLAALYVEKHARARKRSWKQDRRVIQNELLPKWRGLPAAEIRRRDGRELVEAIAERPAPISANRIRALVSKIFNFGVSREVVEFNPCAQLEQPGRERRRDRVLTDEEIRVFWTALDQEPPEIATRSWYSFTHTGR